MPSRQEQVVNFWKNFLDESGCFDNIMSEAEDLVRGIFANVPSSLPQFTDEAKSCMVKNYMARMKLLYSNIIIAEIREILKENNADEAVIFPEENKESLNKALNRAREITGGFSSQYFRDKYSPVLGEYDGNVRKNFTDSMNEFLLRLSLSTREISEQLLDGREITKILYLSGNSADTHRHGRIVMKVGTDAGNFFYKPHDCGLDSFYYELISKYFSEFTCAAKVVEGQGYAFVSELVYEEVNNIQEIGKYYYNFGALTAVFHGLGSADMHEENIIACGVKPSAADIETIIKARETSSRIERKFIYQDFSHWVKQTCVFPLRVHNGPMISALHCISEKNHNTPVYDGRNFNIEGHEEEFIAGFKEGYSRVLKFRDDIKLMFESHENICVRFIMRNTDYYSYMQGYLYASEAMTSREAQAEVLKKLYIPYDFYNNQKGRESFVAYEQSALIQGDIPYYCIYSSGHDVCGENTSDVLYKDYFTQSPKEAMYKNLDILSEKELRFEEDVIRDIFRQVPSDYEEYEKQIITIPSRKIKIQECRDIAMKIFDDIINAQIHMTNGFVMWLSSASSLGSTKPSETFITNQAGIARYCAKLSRFYEPASKIVIECLRHITAQFDIFEREEKLKISTGLFSGLGGVFSALGEIAHENFDGVDAIINRLLKLTSEKLNYNDEDLGVCYGLSGLILALHEVKKKGHSQDLINEIMSKLAGHISEKTLPEKLTGEDGLDGIAAALAVLYSYTGNEKFSEQSINIFRKLRDDYSEDLKGWPDNNAKFRWLAKKSAWSAGVLHSALTASEILRGSEIVHEVLSLAVDSMLKGENLFTRDSIFNGNALSVTALLRTYRQLKDNSCLEKAGQILSGMLEKYNQHGTFNVTPDGINSFFDSSFYFGTPGIGYAILEYISEVGNECR
ncbi:MAG: DUF4135 domain-containing protein [Synergistaceae bacterium]|nr:DUF4135 domain-containing protein [Synergistaceae bacterium]